VISHEVLARRPEGSRVLIGAVREAVVEEQAQGLRAAGVTPARVDVALLGWWRLLADAGQIQERGRQLVLLLHGGTPELIVWQDGEPRLFRTLNGLDGLSEEELAAELSREIGYTLMSVELDQGPAPAAAVAVRHAAGGRFEGVAARLRAGPWGEASVQSLEGLPTASEGLARRLEAGPGLDLTPESWRAAARQRQFRRRMLAGAAAGLGLWALLVSLFYGGLAYERLRLKRLEADYAAVRDPAMEVREMRRRVGLIRRYMDRSSSVLECLREVSLAMPPGLELLSFSYRKGEDVKIRGVGQAVDQVYVFKSGLDESAVFRATTLKGVQERGGKQFFDMDLGLGGGAE
jgi:hypothetical protein